MGKGQTRNRTGPQTASLGRGTTLLRLVPIDFHVVGLAADGDNVDPPVAVEIGGGQIFDRHAAGVDAVGLPFRRRVASGIVDAQAAAAGRVFAVRLLVIANADDE